MGTDDASECNRGSRAVSRTKLVLDSTVLVLGLVTLVGMIGGASAILVAKRSVTLPVRMKSILTAKTSGTTLWRASERPGVARITSASAPLGGLAKFTAQH
ncbi:hypothetical protein [Ferrimicrobium sp.]|uniref:hypothetical protein n=1 Tax=Ferrimicrobium sp. TaxID=2926050 RepID=UPI002625AB22|nr:hypothetical protein [Ferrimicrobium sp.]